jgi:hypothetical protein
LAKGKIYGAIEMGTKGTNALLQALSPLDVLRAYVEYRKSAEVQITERERIWAERDKALLAIEAERDILLVYFKQRFAERKGALEQFFGLLEEGSADKDGHKIDVALDGILHIVGDSPLKDFEAFRKTRRAGRIIDI